MAKFKVGDIVKPNDKSVGMLAITHKGNMLEGVVVISEDDWFSVKITKMAKGKGRYEGRIFRIVFPECFDLVCRKRELHITTDGTTTHAVLKEGGKVVKRAKAVCSPDDEYSFETGARLAIDRVFGKEEKKDDPKEPRFKFKIGDTVTVVNKGETYSLYDALMKQYGDDYLMRWGYGNEPDEMFAYKVVQRDKHPELGKALYVIEQQGELGKVLYIIGEDGLRKAW